jgi:hypothetical protein
MNQTLLSGLLRMSLLVGFLAALGACKGGNSDVSACVNKDLSKSDRYDACFRACWGKSAGGGGMDGPSCEVSRELEGAACGAGNAQACYENCHRMGDGQNDQCGRLRAMCKSNVAQACDLMKKDNMTP